MKNSLQKLLLSCFVFSAFLPMQSLASTKSCNSIYDNSIKVSVNTHHGLNEDQLLEMTNDARTAIQFSKEHFKLPNQVEFNAIPKNDIWGFPHYDETTDRILYTYQFGKMRNGQFITSKTRRHARDIFYHEFGHLIFRHNAGKESDLISFYKDHYAQKIEQGLAPKYMDDTLLKKYISAYNELFADVFSVTLAQNPKAMVSGEYTMYREEDLSGKFHASQKQVLRARDFSKKIDVETWKDGEAHIAFAPARSAFSTDPYAIYLFKNYPERLARLAFDAIQFELRKLFSEDVAALPTLTVPQLNQRLIDTMKIFLENDRIQH